MLNSFDFITPIRAWCCKVLPTVYDDSLSYYELLNKTVKKLNDMITVVNGIPDYIAELLTEDKLTEIVSEVMDELRINIASANDRDSATTTADRTAGELVWWKDMLYTVIRDMNIGDAYIDYSDNPNIRHTTVEELIANLKESFESSISELEETLRGEIEDVEETLNNELTSVNTRVSNVENFTKTFVELSDNVEGFNEGDIIKTTGYSTTGIGAGTYIVHTTNAEYYIPFGNKYAELVYDGEIDIESLGALHEPNGHADNAVNCAISLAIHKNPVHNISGGQMGGCTTIKFGQFGYRFNENLNHLTDIANIVFTGVENGSTYIMYDGTNTLPLFNFPARTDGYYTDNIHIKYLTFMGNGSIISMVGATLCSVEHCRFIGVANGVVLSQNAVNTTIIDCTFYGCKSYPLLIGSNCTTTRVVRCRIIACLNHGLIINGDGTTNGCTLEDSIFEYNAYGFMILGSLNIKIQNCWVEANNCSTTDSDVYLDNVVCAPAPDLTPSVITINAPNRVCTVNAVNIDKNVTVNPANEQNMHGKFEWLDGDVIDYTDRRIVLKSTNVFNLARVHWQINGFIRYTSSEYSFIGSYNFSFNSDFTVTKIGGSGTAPTTNVDGTVTFPTLTNGVIEIDY